MPIQVTTDLPDEDQPLLGNGVEDEVAVDREQAVSNYGDVRIQIRESGESSWDSTATGFGEFIGAYDTLLMEFTGREDGEEYEVRARTETEHVTGAWTEPVSIVTTFPGVTNLSVTGATQTTVDLSGEDNADNEDGFRVLRQRKYDSGWGPWREVGDLSANAGTGTITPTDDTASPGNTYRYKLVAYTEHSSADSNTTTSVTTTSSGRPRERTGAEGWTVHVHHPTADAPLEPRLLDDPSLTPALNDYPRVEIPVPRDEKWQAAGFEDARLSVWKDGRIQPIDELVNVRMEADRTVLEGRGGRQLDDRVQDEYDNTEAHLAAEDLIQNNTSYTVNVDDPASETQSDTKMQSGDTESELREALASAIADDEPLTVLDDGTIHFQQTAYYREGENPDRTEGSPTENNDSQYSGGTEMRLVYEGDAVEYDINVPYRIPADDVGLATLISTDNYNGTRWYVNNTLVDEVPSYPDADNAIIYGWAKHDQNTLSGSTGGYSGGDLRPEDNPHTVRIECWDDNEGNLSWMGIDGIDLYDQGDRFGGFSYTWDESSGYKDGPETRPVSYTVVFESVASAFNVVGGRIDVTIDNTDGQQALYLSNDDGATWQSGANTASFETDFTDAGTSIQWKIDLGRYGSRTDATPKQGIYGQSIDAFTLYADLKDTPVLDAQTYDGQLKNVCNRIAEYGNFIWSLERDQSGWRVEWTQPGQRTADIDDSLADYQVEKSTEQRYEKAVIKGGNQPVVGEEFTAQHDTEVALDQSELVAEMEIVRDPSTGTTYTRGEKKDYVLDYSAGRIKANSGGGMTDGATYEIDYEYKPRGSYTAEDAGSDPATVVRTRPELASNRACKNAALYLIQRVQEPQWSAKVTVPAVGEVSLVDAISWSGLPTRGKRMEVQDIEQSPQQTVLHLGNWTSPDAVLDDFASRISANSDRS